MTRREELRCIAKSRRGMTHQIRANKSSKRKKASNCFPSILTMEIDTISMYRKRTCYDCK
jgi:hypothetical protein